MGFVNDKSEKPWKTIDRERSVSLIYEEVIVDTGIRRFSLIVNKQKFTLEARRGDKYVDDQENLSVTWKIIYIDPSRDVDQTLKGIIQEALETFGTFYQTDKIKNLNVEFLI